jgi:hypothetical protein
MSVNLNSMPRLNHSRGLEKGKYELQEREELCTTSGRYFLQASDGGHVPVTGLSATPLFLFLLHSPLLLFS